MMWSCSTFLTRKKSPASSGSLSTIFSLRTFQNKTFPHWPSSLNNQLSMPTSRRKTGTTPARQKSTIGKTRRSLLHRPRTGPRYTASTQRFALSWKCCTLLLLGPRSDWSSTTKTTRIEFRSSECGTTWSWWTLSAIKWLAKTSWSLRSKPLNYRNLIR